MSRANDEVAGYPREGASAEGAGGDRVSGSENPWESVVAPDTAIVGEGQRLGAEGLADFLARTPRLAVAFSGGVDSAYLLAAAVQAGCEVKAYLVDTAFQPAFELDDAREVLEVLARPTVCRAERLSRDAVPFQVIEADVLSRADICANPPDRCRICKEFIFGAIRAAMARDGLEVLVDGTNASDDPARRPGFAALAACGVTSPLRRAGMTKADVRAASRELGLPTADKPRFACLAVHVPAGERIDRQALDDAAARLHLRD